MADRIIKPDSGNDVVIQNNGGTRKIEVTNAGDVEVTGDFKATTVKATNLKANDGTISLVISDSSGNVSFNDKNISNVGDISLDTISSDAGTSIGVTLGTDAGDDFNVGSGKLVVEGDTGNVGIGTTSPGVRLTSLGAGEGNPATSGTTQTNASARFYYGGGALDIGNYSSGDVWMQSTNPSDLSVNRNIRFQPNGGDIHIGVSSSTSVSRLQLGTDSGTYGLVVKTTDSSGYPAGFFNSSGTLVGYIQTSSSSTSYATSSDYRLKENVTPLTGAIDRLNQLKPSRFNFISDPDITMDGFLAHEVYDYIPEAVSGEMDAVDENGNIEPQGIDQSKLVPLLVASVQELSAKVTALKNA